MGLTFIRLRRFFQDLIVGQAPNFAGSEIVPQYHAEYYPLLRQRDKFRESASRPPQL